MAASKNGRGRNKSRGSKGGQSRSKSGKARARNEKGQFESSYLSN